jgi:response regulator RpfG family c-di-GMP phosphodiesterase
MTNETILFVDDEVNVLQSMKRQLRKRFTILTSESGDDALALLKEQGPVAVIVSDMRMPGMDGIQLLSHVKALYPDTVRIMLTGNADQETAVEAVNTGQIFRFLTKPCPMSVLVSSLALALRQYRLIIAEQQLLNETLKGSIKVLSELLSIANSAAFSSGYRIKMTVSKIAEKMDLPHPWQYEIAALMSGIGCITLPVEILQKLNAGIELSEEEQETFAQHPDTGARLLSHIPRLEKVALMVKNQLRHFNEYQSGEPVELPEEVQAGAQILKAVIDHDLLLHQGIPPREALSRLKKKPEKYNPKVLEFLATMKVQTEKTKVISIKFHDIVPGMVAEDNVFAKNGTLIIPKGQEITWPVIQGLSNFVKHIGIREPIRVRIAVPEPVEELSG